MKALYDELAALAAAPLLSSDGSSELVDANALRPSAATRPEFGDLQISGALALAKKLKQPPRAIAQKVADAVAAHPAIAKVELAGPGFVNLWLKDGWLAAEATHLLDDAKLGLGRTDRGTVVLDYSSPNAAKPMHIGHIRSTIIGDALRRALTAVGYTVVPVNHLGDWGTQFGKLIVAYRRWVDAEAFARAPVDELLRLYIKFGDQEEAEKKASGAVSETADDTDDDKLEGTSEILAEARAELVKLQQGDAANLALWKQFRDASVVELQRIYRRLGVHFAAEDFYGESFYNDRLAATVDELVAKGVAEESKGALVAFFRAPDDSPETKGESGTEPKPDLMPPMLIRKADGGFLYATTDIAALKYRTERWQPKRIIVVTDERQQLHFRQLTKVGERLGITNLEHVWFGLMRLAEGTIATRSGRTISLESLLDEAERRALAVAKAQRPDLTDEDLAEVARVVGIGAVKYNDLSRDRQSLITFTWDKALALNGNTAPYLQYAYARIQSLLGKAGEAPHGEIVVEHPLERALCKQLLEYPAAVEQVASSLRPHYLCDYLFALANTFSSFYNDVTVLKAEPRERASRLQLSQLVGRTLHTGLNVLGIDVLGRM